MPGEGKTFFDLQAYKEDLGVPYAKVTLYLCPESDIAKYEDSSKTKPKDLIKEPDSDCMLVDAYSNWLDEDFFENPFIEECHSVGEEELQRGAVSEREKEETFDGKSDEKVKHKCPTCNAEYTIEEIGAHADTCAEDAHRRTFLDIIKDLPNDAFPEEPVNDDATSCSSATFNKTELPLSEILKPLKVKLESQSRINVRRGQLFVDYMEVRKRCYWFGAENKLKVVFVGEPAEDTGGPRREFLTGDVWLLLVMLDGLLYKYYI